VATSPDDHATIEVAQSVPGVKLHITTAWTDHGAYFNKGLGVEQALDAMGRHGWILIWDADILFPDEIPWDHFRPTFLNGCRRRTLKDPSQWNTEIDWRRFPYERDGGPVGFWQLFHSDDPAIKDRRPWYETTFSHAGGGDCYFATHWAGGNRRVHPFDVLHLGPRDAHWFGTSPEAKAMMSAFVIRNGWSRPRFQVDESAANRVGEIIERVQVPGYEPTGFELPFCRKNK
jgi:hypothetical protein